MGDFERFLEALISRLSEIAEAVSENVKTAFIKDGVAFAEKLRENLQRWAALLAENKLTVDEFKYLVEAQKDLAEMEMLKQAGLAKIRIDWLRNALINAVVESVIAILP